MKSIAENSRSFADDTATSGSDTWKLTTRLSSFFFFSIFYFFSDNLFVSFNFYFSLFFALFLLFFFCVSGTFIFDFRVYPFNFILSLLNSLKNPIYFHCQSISLHVFFFFRFLFSFRQFFIQFSLYIYPYNLFCNFSFSSNFSGFLSLQYKLFSHIFIPFQELVLLLVSINLFLILLISICLSITVDFLFRCITAHYCY